MNHLRHIDKEAVVDKLMEEIKLLKREVAEWKQTVESQHWDLERYKKAFEEIRITMPISCDGNPQGDYACDIHQRIAIEVLKGKDGKEPNKL